MLLNPYQTNQPNNYTADCSSMNSIDLRGKQMHV